MLANIQVMGCPKRSGSRYAKPKVTSFVPLAPVRHWAVTQLAGTVFDLRGAVFGALGGAPREAISHLLVSTYLDGVPSYRKEEPISHRVKQPESQL